MNLLKPRSALSMALSAALVFGIAACGSGRGAQEVHSATVKALWFSGEGDSIQQGVAEVEISVGVSEKPTDFRLDLNTERDQGAGASWTAATWSAASAATLFSFRDPRTLSISASIDGPINGPSAGGLMSATMLAMTAGVPLLPDTTMTGTINPDGSIGLVGGIPAKLRAAKTAGLKKVLIPRSGIVSIDPQNGQPVNVLDEAKQLGLDVTPVSSIFEAMPLLTGRADSLGESGELPKIAQPVLSSIAKSAGTLSQLTKRRLADAKAAGVSGPVIVRSDKARQQAVAALKAGKTVDAYSQLWQTYYLLDAEVAGTQAAESIERNGVDSMRSQLLRDIEDLEAKATVRNDQVADTDAPVIEQSVGLPDVLTWAGHPEFTLGIFRQYLNESEPNPQTLALVAQAVSEARANIEVSLDQSQEALMATQGPRVNQEEVADVLASYMTFLRQTGDANLNYYEQAVANLDDRRSKDVHLKENFDYAFADSMRQALLLPRPGANLPDQRQQLSVAISYYIATAQLIVETELLQVVGLDALDRTVAIENREGFAEAMAASDHTNSRLLRLMNKESIDASYAQWIVEWGRWQATQAGGEFPDFARLYGLTNSWQASIQLLLLNSDPIRDLEQAASQSTSASPN